MPQELTEDLAKLFWLDEAIPSSCPQLMVDSEELFETDAVLLCRVMLFAAVVIYFQHFVYYLPHIFNLAFTC